LSATLGHHVSGVSTLCRHPGRSHIASVLVQNHRNNLSAHVAFEVELRIDNLEKELVFGARVDRESWLTRQLCFEMVAPERDINYGIGSQSVLADVIGERAGVERN